MLPTVYHALYAARLPSSLAFRFRCSFAFFYHGFQIENYDFRMQMKHYAHSSISHISLIRRSQRMISPQLFRRPDRAFAGGRYFSALLGFALRAYPLAWFLLRTIIHDKNYISLSLAPLSSKFLRFCNKRPLHCTPQHRINSCFTFASAALHLRRSSFSPRHFAAASGPRHFDHDASDCRIIFGRYAIDITRREVCFLPIYWNFINKIPPRVILHA